MKQLNSYINGLAYFIFTKNIVLLRQMVRLICDDLVDHRDWLPLRTEGPEPCRKPDQENLQHAGIVQPGGAKHQEEQNQVWGEYEKLISFSCIISVK